MLTFRLQLIPYNQVIYFWRYFVSRLGGRSFPTLFTFTAQVLIYLLDRFVFHVVHHNFVTIITTNEMMHIYAALNSIIFDH